MDSENGQIFHWERVGPSGKTGHHRNITTKYRDDTSSGENDDIARQQNRTNHVLPTPLVTQEESVLERSLKEFQEALLEEDDAQKRIAIFDTMGRICLRQKAMRQAITYFTKQLDLVKSEPLVTAKILFNLGKVYGNGLHDKKKAALKYSKALKVLYDAFGDCHHQIANSCEQCRPKDRHVCDAHATLGKTISGQIEKAKQAQQALSDLSLNQSRDDNTTDDIIAQSIPKSEPLLMCVADLGTRASHSSINAFSRPSMRVSHSASSTFPPSSKSFARENDEPSSALSVAGGSRINPRQDTSKALKSSSFNTAQASVTTTGQSKMARSKKATSASAILSLSSQDVVEEGIEVASFSMQTSGGRHSSSPTDRLSIFSTTRSNSMPKGPSRVIILVWLLIGLELLLDLLTSGIAVIGLTNSFECCGETIEFKAHGARLLGITVPFFVLLYVEFLVLALSIKGYLAMSKRQREAEVTKLQENNSCLRFLGSNRKQQLINFLLTLNPFFGFFVAYLLLYQSNRTECFLVMGLEGGSLLLHWVSIYIEGLPITRVAIVWHSVPIVPFAITVLLILNYMERGGVCYFVQDAYFWYEGCDACANGTLPGDDGICGDETAATPNDYCATDNTTLSEESFCFFGMSSEETNFASLFKG